MPPCVPLGHPSASDTTSALSMLLNIAALGLLVAPHRVSVHRAASAQMGLYDLSANRIDGASVAMADFKGKPLVVVVHKH